MQLLANGRVPGRYGRAIAWAFTGRAGGVSQGPFASLNLAAHVGDEPEAVRRNHERAAALLGLGPGRLAIADAVHGAEVARVAEPGLWPGVDGLVTSTPGLGLVALAADCVPIALMDADAGISGVVHCGWKGLGAGIVAATVARMLELGAHDMQAVIGPHICATCYPVPASRIAELRDAVDGPVAQAACVERGADWLIDVGAGVRAQLLSAGIEAMAVGRCTFEDPSLFSYRRDRVTGRHGVLVAIEESS